MNPPDAGEDGDELVGEPDDEPEDADDPVEDAGDEAEEDRPGESGPEVPVAGLSLSATTPALANPAPASSRCSAAAASLATEVSGFASDGLAELLAGPAALTALSSAFSAGAGEPEPADSAFPFDADLASVSVLPAAAGLTPSTTVSAGFGAVSTTVSAGFDADGPDAGDADACADPDGWVVSVFAGLSGLAVLTGFSDGLASDVELFGFFSRSGLDLDLGSDLPGFGVGPSTLGVTPPPSSASCATGSAWLSTRPPVNVLATTLSVTSGGCVLIAGSSQS